MPQVSNSLPAGDVLEARLARPAEFAAAVSVLLAGTESAASHEQVQNFLALAKQRGLNLADIWVAVQEKHIQWAMLPVVSPGRTMLLLSPPSLPKNVPGQCIAAVVEAACEDHRQKGVQLAQLLLDPAQMSLRAAYVGHGFAELAELIYLQREVKKVPAVAPLPPAMQFINYSAKTHDLFAHTITRSYEQSLDCPGLGGMRDIEDVILGHKGAGDFDPSIWFLLTENGEPLGVLLLGLATHANALELVYLGLIPEARGRGLGNLLMNLALVSVNQTNRAELTVAVDSRNEPAMRLYFRHGLRKFGSRAALIRKLSMDAH
jgi:mycothiol synthase